MALFTHAALSAAFLASVARAQAPHQLEGGVELAWSVQRDGHVPYSEWPRAVASANGRVYSAGIGNSSAGAFALATAHDAATGAVAWAVATSAAQNSSEAAAALLTPDGSRVFVVSNGALPGGPTFARISTLDASSGAPGLAFDYADAGGAHVQLRAAAFDPSGRVLYACGARGLDTVTAEFLTVAFDASSGAVLWERGYDGSPGGWSELARAIAVDPVHGNVVVTGASFGAFTFFDYVTIAYAPDGARQWIARHAGAGNSIDVPQAIGVSPDGAHVVVTGETPGGDETVSYESLTGVREWTASASTSAPSKFVGAHVAFLPAGGGAVVAGRAKVPTSSWGDMRVAAFDDTSGAPLWTTDYASPALGYSDDRAVALAVAPNGARVLALSASQFGNSSEFPVTVALEAADGSIAWTDVGWPSAASGDVPVSLALSADGARAFVATERTLPETTSLGSLRQTHVRALATSDGAALWSAASAHESAHGNDDARVVAVAPNGAQIVTAVSTFTSGGTYAHVTAFGASGAEQWSVREYVAGTSGSSAIRLAYSADGAVLYSARQQGAKTLAQARDAATGAQLWSVVLPQTMYSNYDPQLDLGVAPGSGRVCVVTGFNAYTVHALEPANGAVAWIGSHPAPFSGTFGPRALAFGPDGARVFVTGAVASGTLASVDKVSVAFDMATGAEQWAVGAGVPGASYGADVVASPNGALVCSAGPDGTLIAAPSSTIDAYDAALGTSVWSRTLALPATSLRIVQLACGPDTLYALANTSSAGGDALRLSAFDLATGAPRWDVQAPGSVAKDGAVLALEADGTTLCVAGVTSLASGVGRALAFDASSGALLWDASYACAASVVSGNTLAWSASGHELYVATTSTEIGSVNDVVLDRYDVPSLSALPETISTASGGTQAFALRADVAFANQLHVLAGSLSGSAPGFALGALHVPLNIDAYTFLSVAPSTPIFGGIGTLGAQGQANASLYLAPGALTSLVGLVAHHAFAAVDPQSGSAAFASNAVRLELVP